ncbi:hypothetical protein [Actinotalea solisilvae]|uniref:hypothetical protein n=1 Tax=Actinotalea solisilvae TaxID=2072922 RepID=UPI0018F26C0D|nr:hypothetical protein [Actinotalea solisilvae]
MTHSLRARLAERARGDEGIAIVVAVSLVGIVAVLVLALVATAVHESGASGRDRQRSSAVMTSEAQVNDLVAHVQSTAPGSLPCGTVPPETISTITDQLDVTAEVAYFTAGDVQVDCADVLAGVQVAKATITATSVSDPLLDQQVARRTVETLLRLTPSWGNDLDKAIFGNGGVTLANHASIYGQNGQPDADVYTNGNVTCNNNQHYYGSIYAQGTVSMSNQCVVEVDVHAKGGFSATNPQVSVNGRVLVSNGNASLGKMQLGQQARASGSVTSDSGGPCYPATNGKCVSGVAVPPPAALAFPILKWDAATQTEWANNGYTNVVTFPRAGFPCGWYTGPNLVGPTGHSTNLNGKADGVGAWLFANGHTLTQDTIVVSTCSDPVTLQGIGFTLKDNLAIFANGGVTFSGNSQITSTTSDSRNLYLIQPYDAKPFGCNQDGIALNNQVTVHQTVDVLLYSPCNIRKANNTTHYGQIYAGGQAIIDNQLTMYYQPLPVWGVVTASAAIEYYNVDILYVRENT